MSRPRIRAGNSHVLVPMYSMQGHYVRNISYRDALKLIEAGQARIFHRRDASGRVLDKLDRVQLMQLQTEQRGATATISVKEVYANAGLMGASRTADATDEQLRERAALGRSLEDFVERAQTKVALWPLIGDTKAPRIGPRAEPSGQQ